MMPQLLRDVARCRGLRKKNYALNDTATVCRYIILHAWKQFRWGLQRTMLCSIPKGKRRFIYKYTEHVNDLQLQLCSQDETHTFAFSLVLSFISFHVIFGLLSYHSVVFCILFYVYCVYFVRVFLYVPLFYILSFRIQARKNTTCAMPTNTLVMNLIDRLIDSFLKYDQSHAEQLSQVVTATRCLQFTRLHCWQNMRYRQTRVRLRWVLLCANSILWWWWINNSDYKRTVCR